MTSYIDVHHHILPEFYIDAVGTDRITSQAPRYSGVALEWSAQASLDVMDANHVTSALLSISAPGIWFGDHSATVGLARRCNDYMASLVQQHHDRFGMFAALPLPDVDASLNEIRHASDTLHTDGFGLLSSYGDRHLGDPAFAPVFDELNRRQATVFVHPNVTDTCRNLMPDFPASIIEFPFDTTRTVLSLLFGGTMARCPNVRFIFSHAGGAVPFLAHRMSRLEALPEYAAKTPDGALTLLRRHYYDCALSANPPALDALTSFAPASQLLYGSDFPFAPNMTKKTIDALTEFDPRGDTLTGIERTNALSLFPRFARTEDMTASASVDF